MQLSKARLESLDAEEFSDLCKAYYHSRQFRLRAARMGGDMRDAVLYFGTLPYPVAMLRIIGPQAGAIDMEAIRDVLEVMSLHGVAKGIVHAPGSYTDAAKAFARDNRIRLVSGEDFVRNISSMPQGARTAMSDLLSRERPAQPPALDPALH